MKKLIASVALMCSVSIIVNAQTSIDNVPSNASVVIRYSGKNFSSHVPIKKLDNYRFVKENIFKKLNIDSFTSVEKSGIDFSKDAYQYAVMDDSSTSFISLFDIKDLQQFLSLLQANYHAEMKPVMKNGFEFLALSSGTYIGWNQKQAVLSFTTYNNTNYYPYYGAIDSTVTISIDSAAVAADTVIAVEPEPAIEETPPPPPPAVKKPGIKKGGVKKTTPKAKSYKKGTAKKPVKKKALPKKKEPEMVKDEEVLAAPVETYSYEDTVGQAKRDAWYAEQDKYNAAKQEFIADSIINAAFNSKPVSIATELSYKKITDASADVSVWMNYDNMLYRFWSTYFYRYRSIASSFKPRDFKNNQNEGFRTSVNVFFEKDKMRVQQKMFSPNEEVAALGREIYNSKQSLSLAGFINPDNIACLSASMNTEAMANYYYKLIRQYLTSNPYSNEYADLIDVYMDFLEIIIDEKAIAELMPGNMVMVLHDMKTKMVTYTDYIYDENDFTTKEVKKTKEELSPNFSFVIETKKEAFMKKLANLPLKYAEKNKFNYSDKGGYYELAFDADKYPISSLYFMVKDGKAIVTTSKEVIDNTLANKGYTLDAATKNSVLNNNVYLRINTKKMMQQLSSQLNTDMSKKISNYFEQNMGDVKMEGGLKDGMMQATTTMNITGNNTNSLEFFFNMIDEINDIMEKDKIEKEKKVD